MAPVTTVRLPLRGDQRPHKASDWPISIFVVFIFNAGLMFIRVHEGFTEQVQYMVPTRQYGFVFGRTHCYFR